MKLAMRMPPKSGLSGAANDVDPRDDADAEIIDLAQRNSFPVVAAKKGRSEGVGMVAGIALVAALGAVTLWSMNSARVAEPEGIGSAEPQQAAAVEPTPVAAPAAEAVQPAPMAQSASYADPAPSPVYSAPPESMSATNPYSSPTLVFDSGSSAATLQAGPVAAGEGGAASATGNSASDFASRVGGVGGAPAQAKAMTNPSTTVTQGTLIPAVLETAIDTNVPGYVRAVVSQDVKSFDGTRVLVPRSSRLIGQYQSGLQGGQKRAYVIWTRIIRPDGASVNLASPAISYDGTTGLQGKVSNSFFKRFGSAMLLSVVGGLSALGSGGASVVLGGAGQSAAAVAAQQDGQRGPTVRVRQGEPIRIFTARDLDFTQVS